MTDDGEHIAHTVPPESRLDAEMSRQLVDDLPAPAGCVSEVFDVEVGRVSDHPV